MKIKLENDFVITVTYGNYAQGVGGVDKFIIAQQNILNSRGISLICLFGIAHYFKTNAPALSGLWGVVVDGKYVGCACADDICAFICENQKDRMRSFIINHLMGVYMSDLKKILDCVRSNIIVYVHDYYMICGNYNMLDEDFKICNYEEPASVRCISCALNEKTSKRVASVRELLNSRSDICVTCPSQVAKSVFLNTYPEYESCTYVVPHKLLSGENRTKPNAHRVAYLGSRKRHKGYDLWKHLVENVGGYEYYQFSSAREELKNVTNVPIKFSPDNLEPMPKALIEHEIGIVLLCSIWPETYSYTYIESYIANCFAITLRSSGNIACEVLKNGNGVVLRDENEVIELFRDKEKLKRLFDEYHAHRTAPERFEDNPEFCSYFVEASETCSAPKRKLSLKAIKAYAVYMCYALSIRTNTRAWLKRVRARISKRA